MISKLAYILIGVIIGAIVFSIPTAFAAYNQGVTDTRIGIYTIIDEAANRSTPTGRQLRNDLDAIIRRQMNLALDCEQRIGNAWCLDEYGGGWPPDFP